MGFLKFHHWQVGRCLEVCPNELHLAIMLMKNWIQRNEYTNQKFVIDLYKLHNWREESWWWVAIVGRHPPTGSPMMGNNWYTCGCWPHILDDIFSAWIESYKRAVISPLHFDEWPVKIDVPNSMSYLKWTPMFEGCMVKCESKSRHNKNTYWNEIGVDVQKFDSHCKSAIVT